MTTCGESHGGAVAAIVDGCPPGLPLSRDEIQKELDRRRPGQSKVTSPRNESDEIHVLSGVFDGKTTGAPMLLLSYNKDSRPKDYDHLKDVYRPSHADYTYEKKYGRRDFRGGGRSSARETLARVAAGAIAKKYLKLHYGTEILSYVEQVGSIKMEKNYKSVKMSEIESNIIRCPDQRVAQKMIELVKLVKLEGDSIGGIIRGVLRSVPIGLGEPVFDKIPAELAKAMLSINAVKGFDIGLGFESIGLRGSEHNDEFLNKGGDIQFKTNRAGGTLGGITTGEDIYFRVAFKPVSTIRKKQQTVNVKGESLSLKATGRHDPCVLPRAVPIVEAMAALVIMDHVLLYKAIREGNDK